MKVILPKLLADDRQPRRFEREARAAAVMTSSATAIAALLVLLARV